LLLFLFLELLHVLVSLLLLLGLLIFDRLYADLLYLELDPAQLYDVMFLKLVV